MLHSMPANDERSGFVGWSAAEPQQTAGAMVIVLSVIPTFLIAKGKSYQSMKATSKNLII